jgi:hypothetical protein
MNSVIHHPTGVRTPGPTDCTPKPPVCSTCGQLECLCRPRFFAGQVLSANDLNRLDHYIRAKHKLHNRQLHGWGVVNGLEVTCEPCGKGVVVGRGYALSPCGEDIVVCEPVAVDVCQLIQACREAERVAQPCGPYQSPNPSGCCEDGSEWVLAIRYAETPAKGIKPLMASQSSCSCGCAPRFCTCTSPAATRPRRAPVQCEPTVICEGFAFEVFRKPHDEVCGGGSNKPLEILSPDSELTQRMECCIEMLVKRMPKVPAKPNLTAESAHTWICRFKDFLLRYLSSKPGYNCDLLARVNAISCPTYDANNSLQGQQDSQTLELLKRVWLDALLSCFCSALLPPPQGPSHDLRVPIASLRVSGESCRVLSICNWTHHRKLVMSFPTLNYWLGVLPFGTQLRCLLEKICCFQINSGFESDLSENHNQGYVKTQETGVKRASIAGQGIGEDPAEVAATDISMAAMDRAERRLNPKLDEPQRMAGFADLLTGALGRGSGDLDAATFLGGFFPGLGSSSVEKAGEGPQVQRQLSDVEKANLPQFLLLNQLLRPLATSALEPLLESGMVESLFAAPRAQPEDNEALRQEVAELRTRLDQQATQIEKLMSNKRGNRP